MFRFWGPSRIGDRLDVYRVTRVPQRGRFLERLVGEAFKAKLLADIRGMYADGS